MQNTARNCQKLPPAVAKKTKQKTKKKEFEEKKERGGTRSFKNNVKNKKNKTFAKRKIKF